VAVAAAVLVLGVGAVLAGAGGGYPASRPRLLSGAAWLASSQAGQLTLLDGSSAEVAASVQVATPGDQLGVVQQAATAYAVDDTDGTIRRVDGATFDVSAPVTPLPGAGTALRAFAGADAVYALDARRGVVVAEDPRTLAAHGGTLPLAARVDPQATVMDDAGRLWVLDSASGDLVTVDHGQRHTRRGVSGPGGRLVLVDGAPVVVDPAARTAAVLDPTTAGTRTTVALDLPSGSWTTVSGSVHGSRIYVVAAPGVLDICDLTGAGCTKAVSLGTGTDDLGPPVETGERLFVPDYGTGQVWIVDLRAERVVAQPRVLDPQTRFQLLTRDGVVFFNDPDSERAGVIRLDGGVRQVAKYDPRDPSKGPSEQPSGQPSTGTPSQPAQTATATPTAHRAGLRIVMSTSTARVGEDVTVTVVATAPTAHAAAQWSFGDGHTTTGLFTTHHWDTPRTYQVSVRVTFPDGSTATASTSIQVLGVSVPLSAPTLVSPADGAVLFKAPRDTKLTWLAVPGAARYRVQAQTGGGGSVADTTVTGTSTTFRYPTDGQGRWRVTAVAADGTSGPASGWRTFSYDTRVAAFAGTWNDPTGYIKSMTFQPTSVSGGNFQTMGMCQGDPGQTPCSIGGSGPATLSGTELLSGPLSGRAYHGSRPLVAYFTYRITVVGGQLVAHIHEEVQPPFPSTNDFTETLTKG
jgi:hypothetical protein